METNMTSAIHAPALKPLVIYPQEDRAPVPVVLGAHHIVLKLRGQDTGGNFAAGILRAQPMSGPPLHMHTREDEWFYVLSGEFTFQIGESRFEAGPGTSVFAPRHVPHAWQNFTGELVEALGMVTPPQMEGYFAEMVLHQMDPEERARLNARYGIVELGPPLER